MFKINEVVYSKTHKCFCTITSTHLFNGVLIYSVVQVNGSHTWFASGEQLEALLDLHAQSTNINWNSPTLAEVESIVTNMPGGLDGFLKGWGWLQFAREVEKLCQEKNS